MSAPRPYETDPFRPLGSIINTGLFLYKCQSSGYFFYVLRRSVSVYDNCACAEPILKLSCFSYGLTVYRIIACFQAKHLKCYYDEIFTNRSFPLN